jgi:hypothetical protein
MKGKEKVSQIFYNYTLKIPLIFPCSNGKETDPSVPTAL